MRQIITVSELKGGKRNCLQKIPFSSLWLKIVWYVPVVVFALLFGILVSVWRKNDYTLLYSAYVIVCKHSLRVYLLVP